MDFLKHLPSPIAPSFSEALRIDTQAGCWIFVAGQVGVPLPPDKGSVTFEQEVRTIFERIRDSLSKLGAGMNNVVSIKTYLTDLGLYAEFSRGIRPHVVGRQCAADRRAPHQASRAHDAARPYGHARSPGRRSARRRVVSRSERRRKGSRLDISALRPLLGPGRF